MTDYTDIASVVVAGQNTSVQVTDADREIRDGSISSPDFAPGSVTRAALDAATAAALVTTAPGKTALLYPEHLRRWRAKLAATAYRRAVITAMGDSITWGWFANSDGSANAGTVSQSDIRQYGYVGTLRRLMASKYGDVGEGCIINRDARVTSSGSVVNETSFGPTTAGRRVGQGATLTYALPVCTDIVIYAWWQGSSNNAAWTYTIDGGSAVTVNGPGGSDVLYEVAITGLADTTHTLVINGPATASRTADISMVGAYRGAGGVVVNRFAEPGKQLKDHFGSTGIFGTRQLASTFGRNGTDLILLAYNTNESSISGQAGGATPEQYRTYAQKVIDYAVTINADVLLVAGPRQDLASVGAIPQQAWIDVMVDLAKTNDRVAVLDLAQVWGAKIAAQADGLMADSQHPNILGHADYGRLVYDAIGGV